MGFEEIKAGEMKVIDAYALLKKITSINTSGRYSFCRGVYTVAEIVLEFIKNSPTVDTVKHGRWKKHNSIFSICSNCYYMVDTSCGNRVNYCSNCGAKMDGESNG